MTSSRRRLRLQSLPSVQRDRPPETPGTPSQWRPLRPGQETYEPRAEVSGDRRDRTARRQHTGEQTRERLLRAGFAEARCWLEDAPKRPDQPREFLSGIVLGPHVQRLPPELREPFMDEVLDELGGELVVDYVRLNIDAVA